MRLVEFLVAILEAHAESLKRLAALLGEENLVQVLEMAGDDENRTLPESRVVSMEELEEPNAMTRGTAPYAELEGAVRDFNLPAELEFHLWAYPHYRAFIESPLDLNSRIPGPGGETGLALVNEAVAQAEAWVKSLPIGSPVSLQAQRATHVAWLRFRTQVLKRIGKRPLGPVY